MNESTNSCRFRPRLTHLEDRIAPSFGPIGPEFRVNTFTNAGGTPAAAMDADGNFVVVWLNSGQDGSQLGVYAQLFSAVGIPQGVEFRVNTYTLMHQYIQGVAMDAGGDFVVAWTSNGQDGDGGGIYAQRYNSDGVPQGGEFQVNTHTTGSQGGNGVAMDAAGNFVISWASQFGNDSANVYAQRYNSDGVPQGGEFQVNTYTTGLQDFPDVAMDADGDFVIVWRSSGQDGSGAGVYAQQFSAAGDPQGVEFRVNTYTTENQGAPGVAMDADGAFVVAWLSRYQDGSSLGIYAQSYSADGVPQGGEFQVNTYTTNGQANPAVAMDVDGDFAIVWASYGGQDGSGTGVYAQHYTATGMPDGNEFRVNTYSTGGQNLPATAMDADGDFVIAWAGDGQDGYGVYAQRYVDSATPVVQSVAVNGGAQQRSRVTNLAVTFDTQVTFASTVANAFTLSRNGGGSVNFSATASVFGAVTVVTLNNFTGGETESGSLRDGRYTLTALASQISANGQQMASNYTFGDAQGLYRFYGDLNGDRRVDISDFGFFSLAYLQAPNYNAALDFNNDGRIDIADFGQFSVRFFTTLP